MKCAFILISSLFYVTLGDGIADHYAPPQQGPPPQQYSPGLPSLPNAYNGVKPSRPTKRKNNKRKKNKKKNNKPKVPSKPDKYKGAGSSNKNNKNRPKPTPRMSPMDMLRMSVPGEPGRDYPIFSKKQKPSFSCSDLQTRGYYADPATDCQQYVVCPGYTFLCPNGTIFNQKADHCECEWWFDVDCSSANLQQGCNQPGQGGFRGAGSGNVPQTGGNVPPSGGYVPPSREYVPPTREYVPPSGGYVPPSGGNVPEYEGVTANPCPHGKPLTDASGSQLFCGRGPNRQDCPSGSSCLIHPADKYAVCCTDETDCKKCESVVQGQKCGQDSSGPFRMNCSECCSTSSSSSQCAQWRCDAGGWLCQEPCPKPSSGQPTGYCTRNEDCKGQIFDGTWACRNNRCQVQPLCLAGNCNSNYQ